MRFVLRLSLFAALLVIVNVVTSHVISANFIAGTYPSDADSIGIPMMETLFASLIALAMLLPLLLLSSLPWSFRKAATSRAWRRTIGVLLAGFYLWNFLLQANWALYWIDPDHWPIGASIGLVAAAVLWLAIVDFGRVLRCQTSEVSGEPAPATAAPDPDRRLTSRASAVSHHRLPPPHPAGT